MGASTIRKPRERTRQSEPGEHVQHEQRQTGQSRIHRDRGDHGDQGQGDQVSHGHHGDRSASEFNRRLFVGGAVAAGVGMTLGRYADAASSKLSDVYQQVLAGHDAAVQRLQGWIREPAIAAENRGMSEGCEYTMNLLREAGFQTVERQNTDGHPGIFATLDAGAKRTVGVYFMYDVKQADPGEWCRHRGKRASSMCRTPARQ